MLFLWILRDCSCFLILVARSMRKGRVLSESKILEKICKFAQQLSRPGKSLENWVKVLKNCKKCEFFLSCSKCFIREFFFSFCLNLIQSRPYVCCASWKKLCSCGVFFKDLLITYLITLSLEKKLLFWKKSGKSLEFWIQKFVRTLDLGKIEVACVTGAKRGGERVGKREKSAKGEGR